MENLLYSPRELGVRNFGFDIGDVIYYHFTGECETIHRNMHMRGMLYGRDLPDDVPLDHSSHFLVLDFSFKNNNIEAVNIDELEVKASIQEITSGEVYNIFTNRRTFLKKEKIRNGVDILVARITSELYDEDPDDPGIETLTFKTFKVSHEDQKAFEKVLNLTSWFMDSRNTIQSLKSQIRSSNK